MATALHAVIRKIWDDQPRPATGALGRIYVGRLAELPAFGNPLTLFVDRGPECGPVYLVTEPVVRMVGSWARGSVLVDTGTSIYRVSFGAPRLPSLAGRGAVRARERRSYRRLRLATAIAVARQGERRQIGVTADLSAGGLRFASGEPFEVGETIEITVKLGQTSDLQTHLSGRVVRVEATQEEDRPRFSHATVVAFDEPWA